MTMTTECVKARLPDGVLQMRVVHSGFRFEFRDRTLPRWWFDLANHFQWAMVDNDPGGVRGRDVSIIKPAVDHRLTFGEPGSIYN